MKADLIRELAEVSAASKWRSAYVVFWNEVVYQGGKIVSTFPSGSTLYPSERLALEAKEAARTLVALDTAGGLEDGIYRMPAYRGSARDVVIISARYYALLESVKQEHSTFTTIAEWEEYYKRRIAGVPYTLVSDENVYGIIDPAGNLTLMFENGDYISVQKIVNAFNAMRSEINPPSDHKGK